MTNSCKNRPKRFGRDRDMVESKLRLIDIFFNRFDYDQDFNRKNEPYYPPPPVEENTMDTYFITCNRNRIE